MIVEPWELAQDQKVDDLAVLAEPWQFRQVDVSELEDLEYRDQEPEGDVLLSVVGENRSDEVHALDISDLWVIMAKRQKDLLQNMDSR